MTSLKPSLYNYYQDIFRGHMEEEDLESRNTPRPDRSLGGFVQEATEDCYIYATMSGPNLAPQLKTTRGATSLPES
jgi:hypothetical protein